MTSPLAIRFPDSAPPLTLQPDAHEYEPALAMHFPKLHPGQVYFTHYFQQRLWTALGILCDTKVAFEVTTKWINPDTLPAPKDSSDLVDEDTRPEQEQEGAGELTLPRPFPCEADEDDEDRQDNASKESTKRAVLLKPSTCEIDEDGTEWYAIHEFLQLVWQAGCDVSPSQVRRWASKRLLPARKAKQTGKGFARGKRYWLFRDDEATMVAVHKLASCRRAQPSAPEGYVARSRTVELSHGAILLRRLRYLEQTCTLTLIKQQDRVYYSLEACASLGEGEGPQTLDEPFASCPSLPA